MKEEIRKPEWWLLLLGGVESLIFLSLCFGQGVWGDEMFTFQAVNQSFYDMTIFTAKDVHPPLYYYIVKLAVSIFGRHIWVAKLVTVAASLGLIVLGLTKVWRNWGTKTAVLFLLSVICMPQMLRYSVQLRMYSWAMLFVTLTLLEFYDIVLRHDSLKTWIIMTISGLAAAYTHYYALIAVAVIYAILFVHVIKYQRIYVKRILIIFMISTLGYLPWFFVLIKQITMVKQSYWIEPITAKSIGQMLLFVFLPQKRFLGFFVILLYIVGCIYFIKAFRKQPMLQDIYGAMVYFGVFASGVILSAAIRPIFVVRYLVPAMPALYLSFSVLMKRVNRSVYVVAILVLLSVGVVSYVESYAEEYPNGMKETQEYLNENVLDGDVIVSDFGEAYVALDYYYQGHPMYYYTELDQAIREYEDVSIWFFATQDTTIEELEQKGYRFDVCYEYGRLDGMIFTLYRIAGE